MTALSRRRMLLGGAAAGAGFAALTACTPSADEQQEDTLLDVGSDTVPFFGTHQAGVATKPQAFATFAALTLRDDAGADAIRRMLQVLTDDASRLTQGRGALADTEPELAAVPARLTVTPGFGSALVRRVAGSSAVPSWLKPLPAFGIDELDDRWTGGDLLLHVAADDQVTVAHAVRMLLKTAWATAVPSWRQSGFRRSRGSEEPGTTMLRRSYNYDDDTAVAGDGEITDAGLLFLAYQRDVDEGFVPVQRRLDELDLLNQWTTPVGSAVFAIPPGCQEGGFIGDTLF